MNTKISIRNIDPDTYWEAKIYAAQTRWTMGEVITEALARYLQDEGDECDDDEDTQE